MERLLERPPLPQPLEEGPQRTHPVPLDQQAQGDRPEDIRRLIERISESGPRSADRLLKVAASAGVARHHATAKPHTARDDQTQASHSQIGNP